MLVYQRVAPAFFRSKLVRRFAADGPRWANFGNEKNIRCRTIFVSRQLPKKGSTKTCYIEIQHISQSTITLYTQLSRVLRIVSIGVLGRVKAY